jgi:hypothetical protein
LTESLGGRWQVIVSGGAAVVAVHVVVGLYMWRVYKDEIVKEE